MRSTLVLILFLPLLVAIGVSSVPLRQTTSWAVILCKFKGTTEEPKDVSYFNRWFGQAGNGYDGLYDYWRAVSYGAINTAGSVVKGWYTMPYTVSDESSKSRYQKIQDCVQTAKDAGYTVPSGYYITAIVNKQIDSGFHGSVLLDPYAWFNSFAAHEMGHAYGLDHSYTNNLKYKNADWSAPGEYGDPWDVMSVQNAYMYNSESFGLSGPSPHAYNRDRKGWIWWNRIYTFGANGAQDVTLTIADLNTPSASGPLLVRVPHNPSDAFNYYTVELRIKAGVDKAIPKSTVLIHEIKNGISYTQELPNGPEFTAGKTFNSPYNPNLASVQIQVLSIGTNTATIRIRGDIAIRCLQGYVWREAFPGDYVCVTPFVRTQTAIDNALASSRRQGYGPYGPDTCKPGFVWREARPSDHVCVPVVTRAAVAMDNQQAANRRNPARFVYGPNTCKPGFVWREADSRDYVCVTPLTRSLTAYDNSQAAARRQGFGPYGPDTCKSGYVWREAFPGDHVCVALLTRIQAFSDNVNTANRYLKP